MTALDVALDQRRGKGVSDEDEEPYVLGFNDALSMLLSDEVYYTALDGKTGKFQTLEEVVEFMRTKEFEV